MNQYAVFSSLFFRVYAVLWVLIKPFVKSSARLKHGWAERAVPDDWARPVDIWLHAASAGEVKLVLAVLEQMPAQASLKVLITTMTKQGKDTIKRELPTLLDGRPWLGLTVRYAPLDEPATARRAMQQASPKVLILFETELWPGLLGACAECGVPAHLLNARLSKASLELLRIIKSSLRSLPIFSIHAITTDDALRFRQIFGRDTLVPCLIDTMPNIKFDSAAKGLASPISHRLKTHFRLARQVFLLASVRKAEEKRLSALISKLYARLPQAVVVLVPRHLERVEPLRQRLYDLGLRPQLASQLESGEAVQPGRVLIWDGFGALQDLYAVADAVFVGGSLVGGGHNFLEALATGIVPCVGPNLEHFDWAVDAEHPPSLIERNLLTVCQDSAAVLDCLQTAASTGRDRFALREKFGQWLATRTGGSRQAALLTLDFLEQSLARRE